MRSRPSSSSSSRRSFSSILAVATAIATVTLLLISTPPVVDASSSSSAAAAAAASASSSSSSATSSSGWFFPSFLTNNRLLQDEDDGDSDKADDTGGGLQSVDQPSAPVVPTTVVIHPVGTELWYEDPETGLWDQGTISGYSATKGYYITWSSDGSTEQYTNTTLVDEMVDNDASSFSDNNDSGGDYLSDYEPWEIGSFVLHFFDFDDGKAEGSGTYGGTITDFTRQVDATTNTTTSASYTITWSDGEVATYDDLRLVDVMIQSYENYEPWVVGTQVALSQNGISWIKGDIVSFDEVGPPVYKIQWEADAGSAAQSLQTYHNLDLVDQHVQDYIDNADVLDPTQPTDDGIVSIFEDEEDSDSDGDDSDYVPYSKDTPVHYLFDGEGYDGTIVHYHVDTQEYEVLWEDDETSYYGTDQFELVDEMVTLAKYTGGDDDDNLVFDDDSLEAEYDIGTTVYTDFDGEWWVGEIVSFDAGWYTVRYADDSYVDYSYSGSIHELVVNAEDIPSDEESQKYPVGTRVVEEFPDGYYEGSITNYAELTYTVVWSDGETDYYVDGEELDSIVTQGKLMPSLGGVDSQGGMSKIGKLFVSVLVILAAAAGIVFFQKRIKAVLSKSLSSNVAARTRARLLGRKEKEETPIFIRKSSGESSLPEPSEASIATGEESVSISEPSSADDTEAEHTTSTEEEAEEEEGTTASTTSYSNDDAEEPTNDLPGVV
eukprot:CAMPEP_0113495462 /NCGR_PEP_ID=MMETSP0014_2-20120614/29623_1 /TAXON_ID=2857 /ORGANISM="Nitzschia sp." /LENGTH=716 /DNA_ID=CAMNT_0000389363 /DNA_START=68 /DNA_END=2218 /DNA_ORIENTATION=+ /assembly_acc=CAM_ASM_000159